jgi:hypothetical protein
VCKTNSSATIGATDSLPGIHIKHTNEPGREVDKQSEPYIMINVIEPESTMKSSGFHAEITYLKKNDCRKALMICPCSASLVKLTLEVNSLKILFDLSNDMDLNGDPWPTLQSSYTPIYNKSYTLHISPNANERMEYAVAYVQDGRLNVWIPSVEAVAEETHTSYRDAIKAKMNSTDAEWISRPVLIDITTAGVVKKNVKPIDI